MKPQLFFLLLGLFLSSHLFAQDTGFSPTLKLGVLAGYNNASAENETGDFVDIESLDLFHIGASLNVHLLKRFSLEPVLLLNRKGYESIILGDIISQNNLDYLSLQLLGKIHFTKNIILLAGMENSYLASTSDLSNFNLGIEQFETLDLSIIAGLEFALGEKWAINVKYNHSVTPFVEFISTDINGNLTGESALRSRVFMAGVTYYPFRLEMF